eukprot:Opistho-2@60531
MLTSLPSWMRRTLTSYSGTLHPTTTVYPGQILHRSQPFRWPNWGSVPEDPLRLPCMDLDQLFPSQSPGAGVNPADIKCTPSSSVDETPRKGSELPPATRKDISNVMAIDRRTSVASSSGSLKAARVSNFEAKFAAAGHLAPPDSRLGHTHRKAYHRSSTMSGHHSTIESDSDDNDDDPSDTCEASGAPETRTSLEMDSGFFQVKFIGCLMPLFRRYKGLRDWYYNNFSNLTEQSEKIIRLFFFAMYLLDWAWVGSYMAEQWNIYGLNSDDWYYVNRNTVHWTILVFFSFFMVIESIVRIAYAGRDVTRVTALIPVILIDLLTVWPFIVSLFWVKLRSIYIPSYLRVWHAHMVLRVFVLGNSVKQRIDVRMQLTFLVHMLCCLMVTGMCGFRYFSNDFYPASSPPNSFLDSFYFMVVTMSTVGYGDIVAENQWARVFVICLIIVSLIIIPESIARLAQILQESSQYSGSYKQASNEKHVVVYGRITYEGMKEFFNEFYRYEDPSNKTRELVVMMSTTEPSRELRAFLLRPYISKRAIFLEGSALVDKDLHRADVSRASAVFLLADTSNEDADVNKNHDVVDIDRSNILRSWAIRMYSTEVPLYVNLLRAENRYHIEKMFHCDRINCSEEMKMNFLALNCIAKGASTLITNLVREQSMYLNKALEGRNRALWVDEYISGTATNIRPMIAGGFLVGMTFSDAAALIHLRFDITLMAVRLRGRRQRILLNPSVNYRIRGGEELFVCSRSDRELDDLRLFIRTDDAMQIRQEIEEEMANSFNDRHTRRVAGIAGSFADLLPLGKLSETLGEQRHSETVPPNYVRAREEAGAALARRHTSPAHLGEGNAADGTKARDSPTSLVREQHDCDDHHLSPGGRALHSQHVRKFGSLADRHGGSTVTPTYRVDYPPAPYPGARLFPCYLTQSPRSFDESTLVNAEHLRGHVIVCSEKFDTIFQLVARLRAADLAASKVRPIVLLGERPPPPHTWTAVSWFPEVYYVDGSGVNVEDLVRAGGKSADRMIVISFSSTLASNTDADSDKPMLDSRAIMITHMIGFINDDRETDLATTTELLFPENMKFLAITSSGIEKRRIPYFLQPSYAAGRGWTARMIDSVSYAAHHEPFLYEIMLSLVGSRERLGGSSVLMQVRLPPALRGEKFSTVFHHFAVNYGIIVLGLYRSPSEPLGNVLPFVYTNPPSDTIVHPADLIFVLQRTERSEA